MTFAELFLHYRGIWLGYEENDAKIFAINISRGYYVEESMKTLRFSTNRLYRFISQTIRDMAIVTIGYLLTRAFYSTV